jgi:hypothetical protein
MVRGLVEQVDCLEVGLEVEFRAGKVGMEQ